MPGQVSRGLGIQGSKGDDIGSEVALGPDVASDASIAVSLYVRCWYSHLCG